MSVENIKTQIAGLKSLVDLAEREAVKLSDYKVKASSIRARRALHQLEQPTRQLSQDLLSEKKAIPVKKVVRSVDEPITQQQKNAEPIVTQSEKPELVRQPAIALDPPPEEKKKVRGRPRKVNVQLYN